MPEPHAPLDGAPRNPDVRRERTDAHMRLVLVFGAVLVLVAVITHVLLWVLHEGMRGSRIRELPEAPAIAKERPHFPQDLGAIPEPRLQTSEEREMKELLERDKAILRSHGWADAKKQAVRIPIDDAIKILSDPDKAAKHGVRAEALKGK